ncbi:M60 family metallopeptidase [Pedobacter frigoris]|uniref:M60 family metallopeptidase n=1 Tax=Pedobacter frigoris TaxID=2571272 RepID=UPI00292DB69A|nr:M60 family metallopeptidase [Pedobacter frigoris]
MKNTIFSIRILVAFLLLSLASCKKYGYEFEDGFNKPSTDESEQTLDTSMTTVDRSLYARARIFPGLVEASEPRLKDVKFTLDLNFSASNSYLLRISVAPEPQFSTGFYAPAGELIKIVVPAGVNGLSVQVGGHTDNLTGQLNLKRDPLIYTVKQLYPGNNYVRNPYGGTIYIHAAFGIPQPVEFTITGAVKSPDFVLGKSTDSEWVAEVKASTVPWLELRSNRVIFLIPRDFLIRNFNSSKPLTNPTALMTAWNAVFEEDYNKWMGLSDNALDKRDRSPQAAWREILDIQPSVGYGHSGTPGFPPIVATMDDEWFNSVVSLDQLLHGANWGTYHEFGHNCQQGSIWSWKTLGETTNNLFNYKVANRNGASFAIQHGDEWVQPALNFAATNTSLTIFDSPSGPMEDPFKRMIPFLQIFGIYGYDAMPYLYTAARHAERFSNTELDKHDFVYERFSEYARTDLKPFFEAWGIEITPQSKTKIAAKFPLLTKQVWTYNPMTKTGGTADIVYKVTVSANSEETGGEGPVSGYANAMIDGDNNTFWHSKWSANPVGNFPYTILLNMGTPAVAKGIYIVPRNSSAQRPKNIEIYSSTDNVNWTLRGTTQVTNAFARFNYNFSSTITAQYYKLILKDNHSGTNTAAIAELNIIR